MKKTLSPRRAGQMAISMVISILLFLMLMFPVMDLFVQNEGRWSVKEKKSTTAFHLAEAGVDRARWKLLESDDMWIMTGTGTIAGYNFDQVYSAESGGTYTIQITSHPVDADMRVVESVGRDRTGAQLRRIRAVLRNDNAADFATRAANMVSNTGGNDHIEWGPVISGNSIDATGRTFPRYYSAGHVTPQDGGSTSASTDNVYWWSYYEIPQFPKIKFSTYLSSAQASDLALGGAPNGCGNGNSSTYYHIGNAEFKGCNDTSNRTYYITGDVTFQSGGGGNFIRGTMIMLGNFIISGSGGADGNYDAKVPPEAWKEYGNNWAHYQAFDAAAPATWAAAVSGNYVANNLEYELDNVLIHGFAYTGGSQGLQGGGNCNINGVLLSNQDATMGTSTMGIYYDDNVARDILIQGVNIKLHSWYEVKAEWPSGL
ncbi:MAG: hypothetical protein CVU79_02620 [Elusimicrobia bacterium HGW-Elusimicrobia-3]|nr:MAG: hypothetical protein CVU79_02620 [Elusimicrobia bacterium HGW-Elusimicrobia-3]